MQALTIFNAIPIPDFQNACNNIWNGCEYCDCPPPDCSGVCGGNAIFDQCNICNGNNLNQDCNGDCFGTSLKDMEGLYI